MTKHHSAVNDSDDIVEKALLWRLPKPHSDNQNDDFDKVTTLMITHHSTISKSDNWWQWKRQCDDRLTHDQTVMTLHNWQSYVWLLPHVRNDCQDAFESFTIYSVFWKCLKIGIASFIIDTNCSIKISWRPMFARTAAIESTQIKIMN